MVPKLFIRVSDWVPGYTRPETQVSNPGWNLDETGFLKSENPGSELYLGYFILFFILGKTYMLLIFFKNKNP